MTLKLPVGGNSLSDSLNHSFKRFIKKSIYVEMKQVTVIMNGSLNH